MPPRGCSGCKSAFETCLELPYVANSDPRDLLQSQRAQLQQELRLIGNRKAKSVVGAALPQALARRPTRKRSSFLRRRSNKIIIAWEFPTPFLFFSLRVGF
jgi:hypothetical protein